MRQLEHLYPNFNHHILFRISATHRDSTFACLNLESRPLALKENLLGKAYLENSLQVVSEPPNNVLILPLCLTFNL